MQKSLKKSVAAAICAGMIFSSGIYSTPAFAAEENVTQEIQISNVVEGNAYIPKGTVLQVELRKEISSKKSKVGDTIPFKLVENLIINDVIVAPAGSEVKGIITISRKAGGFGRGGKLEFKITSLKTLNGVEIPLEYTQYKHGAGDGGAVAVAALVSGVGGFLMKGKNVVYNEGMRIDAEVTADTDLNCSLENLQEEMDSAKPHGVSITIK